MCTLLRKSSKEGLSGVVFLFFGGECSQDGRSGVQGVSKGCLTGVPDDPNVAPAMPNVAHGAAKVAAGVSQGAQREPMAWPRAPTRCPREPKGCPWCSLGCFPGASWVPPGCIRNAVWIANQNVVWGLVLGSFSYICIYIYRDMYISMCRTCTYACVY